MASIAGSRSATSPCRLDTLLVKLSNWDGPATLTLKLSDNLNEIIPNFVTFVRRKGWSEPTVVLLEILYSRVPDQHGVWDNAVEDLAAFVAQRDGVYNRVIISRPKDSLLRQERGRYLAWLGRWDDALAVYDTMIQDHPTPEDAFVEYAFINLIKGDIAAYRKWSARVADKFGKTAGPFAGTMLVRACGIMPDSGVDNARLISWAEQAVSKQPSASSSLHCMALALLRSGQFEKALIQFQASIDAGEDSARNWYGLALANWRLGRLEEAGRWIDRAGSWMEQKKAEFADRTTHPSPPTYITDWLEMEVLRRETDAPIGNRRLGNVLLVDRSGTAGQELRVPLGAVNLRPDVSRDELRGSLSLVVHMRTKPPVVDGTIGLDEYGAALAIDLTRGVNPGRLLLGSAPVASSRDLSAELSLAYTKNDLFIAVGVHDDRVVISPTEFIPNGDSVELFIDGDRQANDFDRPDFGDNKASREGFQLGIDASGRTFAKGIGSNQYTVAVARRDEGYCVEYRIPLSSIDVDDGAEVTPPGPGATLRFNLGIVDNDEISERQNRYAMLWSDDPAKSPFFTAKRAGRSTCIWPGRSNTSSLPVPKERCSMLRQVYFNGSHPPSR